MSLKKDGKNLATDNLEQFLKIVCENHDSALKLEQGTTRGLIDTFATRYLSFTSGVEIYGLSFDPILEHEKIDKSIVKPISRETFESLLLPPINSISDDIIQQIKEEKSCVWLDIHETIFSVRKATKDIWQIMNHGTRDNLLECIYSYRLSPKIDRNKISSLLAFQRHIRKLNDIDIMKYRFCKYFDKNNLQKLLMLCSLPKELFDEHIKKSPENWPSFSKLVLDKRIKCSIGDEIGELDAHKLMLFDIIWTKTLAIAEMHNQRVDPTQLVNHALPALFYQIDKILNPVDSDYYRQLFVQHRLSLVSRRLGKDFRIIQFGESVKDMKFAEISGFIKKMLK